jgi:hypothetical protein
MEIINKHYFRSVCPKPSLIGVYNDLNLEITKAEVWLNSKHYTGQGKFIFIVKYDCLPWR